MNKEKLIEAKNIVMYEIGQTLEKATKQELSFDKQMAIAAVLGDLTATLDDKLDDIIQTEPEETKTSDCKGCHEIHEYQDIYKKAEYPNKFYARIAIVGIDKGKKRRNNRKKDSSYFLSCMW